MKAKRISSIIDSINHIVWNINREIENAEIGESEIENLKSMRVDAEVMGRRFMNLIQTQGSIQFKE
jgi:hypothetical protein